jgi:hypothetical protein
VSSWRLESAFLFADETRAVVFPLTGARLRAVLETALGDANFGRGGYLQLSGVAFAFDLRRPEGARIVGEMRRPSGTTIGPDEMLAVAFVAYPACEGGDGYAIPEARDGDACRRRDEGPRVADLLLRHVEGMGGEIVPPPGGRVRRIE